MLVQWLQIYETDLSVVMSILKALSPHFDDYLLYNVDESNILVVARRDGLVPDPDAKVLASPALQWELRRGGIVGVEDLLSRRIGKSKRRIFPRLAARRSPTVPG
jgi:spermidine synthase